MSTTELVTLIANLALTLSVIVAVIFGLAQVRAGSIDRRERLTLDTLRNFQTNEFAKISLFVTGKKMPGSRKEMSALPDEEQSMVFQFAQLMESLGILVGEGLIDIDLVDITLGSFVVSTWERYKPMFTEMRVAISDPFLGEYFQWLAERIEERMRDHPRRPVFESAAMVPRHKMKRKHK